jgi:hypothetical protein
MPSKRIIAVLLDDGFVYRTAKRLNGVYITDSVSTLLLITQNYRQASLIAKEGLNATGKNNKIATDNGAPE